MIIRRETEPHDPLPTPRARNIGSPSPRPRSHGEFDTVRRDTNMKKKKREKKNKISRVFPQNRCSTPPEPRPAVHVTAVIRRYDRNVVTANEHGLDGGGDNDGCYDGDDNDHRGRADHGGRDYVAERGEFRGRGHGGGCYVQAGRGPDPARNTVRWPRPPSPQRTGTAPA